MFELSEAPPAGPWQLVVSEGSANRWTIGVTATATLWARVRGLLSSNPGLVDLAPFGCLREVGQLSFYENAALVDLGALARIESAERIHIDTSPITALPTFAPGYRGIRSLSLRDLPELTDLDAMAGWPGLHNPEGFYEEMKLHIVGAPRLTSVAGLESALADGVAAVGSTTRPPARPPWSSGPAAPITTGSAPRRRARPSISPAASCWRACPGSTSRRRRATGRTSTPPIRRASSASSRPPIPTRPWS